MRPRLSRALFLACAVCLVPLSAWGSDLAHTLWTAAELAGKPGEARSGPLVAPDPSGPDKPAPEATRASLPPPLRGSIRRVDTGGRKLVALTFDLCELADKAAGYDSQVVDALRELNVPATFFAGGRWMRSHPERTMQLLADSRFELGSHAWTHGNFGVLSEERMRRQLDWAEAQFEAARQALAEKARAAGCAEFMRAVPTSMAVFRFPYGRCRAEALDLLAAKGVAAVQWDVNTMDADKHQTPQGILSIVTRRVRPGSIVLAHANGNGHGTGQAVRLVVSALREKGYEFVTVSALLAAGRAETATACYDSRPGDTAAYDAIFGDGTLHPHR
ncbi:polysaccharide deacetylase family protein [Fundidesulfovibrio butyratiphilus]